MMILSIKKILQSYKSTRDVIPFIILALLILFTFLLITDLATLKLLYIVDESQELLIIFEHLPMVYIIWNWRSEIYFHLSIPTNHFIWWLDGGCCYCQFIC